MATRNYKVKVVYAEDFNTVIVPQMLGRTFVSVDAHKFERDDGVIFEFFHQQDCCEEVSLESVVGDLSDLEGEPLLRVEMVQSDDDPPESACEYGGPECYTWTFYKFATRKGYVDVRWFGQSNGYYSESVDVCVCTPDREA